MYSKQVLKHFKNPHNQGKMAHPTVVGFAGNPICGDTMKVYLRVKSLKHALPAPYFVAGSLPNGLKVKSCGKTSPNPSHSAIAQGRLLSRRGNARSVSSSGTIEDIKFETLGCAAAIASSSVLTDMAKGKALDEALKITKEAVVKKLGGLPLHKEHCSLIAVDALHDAINKLK